MTDTDMKLSKFIGLLIRQTKAGKLLWRESYRNSFQAALSDQTIVIRNAAFPVSGLFEPVLEIRDSQGEIVQWIGATLDPISSLALNDKRRRSDPTLISKVAELVQLLENEQAVKLSETLDHMLKELEK